MLITQVRNATLIVEFGGVKFLIDPMLGDRGAYPGLPGTLNSHLPYPTASLKTPIEEILAVDAVSITHTHPDHFDQAAQDLIPKDLPLFVQHEADAALVKVAGFTDTRLLESIGSFNGVRLHKTPGRHGTDAAYAAIGSILGEVCGVEDAHRLKMRASPTVRIDGRDIALEFKVSRCKECGELCECVGGVDCRVWVWRGE